MKKYIMTMASLVIFTGLIWSAGINTQAANTVNDIEQGVYIGDIEVSGMTTLEAEQAVQEYVTELSKKEITLDAMNNNKVTVTAQELGISWANPSVVDEAGQIGKSGNIVQRYKALKDLEHENAVLPIELSFDTELVQGILEEECAAFNVEAVDATMTRVDGSFEITPGQTGVVIDVEGSTEAIAEYLTTEWDGENTDIELVVDVDEPRGTEEELAKVKDVLGTFTTDYASSGSNRSGNVVNGCELINGTLLYPGDQFSTYETVSPFTEANGYYLAGSYSNGLVVESLGGGICQVSTTLYNAVLLAELEVTERFNHSMIIGYVDPSCDAAISGTAKDFKFVNTLDYPIYIEGNTSSNKKVTFTIYGVETRPSNREVSYESEIISKTVPEGEKIVADGGMAAGAISIQSAHIGYKAQLWKIVTVDGEVESKEVVNSSSYAAVPRTATVGVSSADPNVVAALNAAIATGSIAQVQAVAASATADPAAAAVAAQQAAAQAAAQAAQDAAQAAQQAAAQAAADAAAGN